MTRFTRASRHLTPSLPGISFLVLLAACLAAACQARALPRYTAQYGQSCTLCHVNPTGGGMRTQYASQYIVPEEIASRGWDEAEKENLSPQISPNITIGADLRTLTYQAEGGSGSSFAMQGDLYLDIGLGTSYLAYIEQGLSGSGEIFGMGRTGYLDGYFKAGRFVPDYGWRFADHQMFSRRYLLESAGSEDPASLYSSGFEVGISPGMLTASASLLDGRGSNGDSYAARAMVQETLGGLNWGVGASVLRREYIQGQHRAAGGFWYLGLGPVTWLGQVDETSRDGRLGNLVSQEVVTQIKRGLDLRFTYNFQDPDRSLKNGARHRYGAGVASMPRPFLSLLLMGNYWKTDQGELISGNDYYEGQFMVHFFY
jgi:hypothetical protein